MHAKDSRLCQLLDADIILPWSLSTRTDHSAVPVFRLRTTRARAVSRQRQCHSGVREVSLERHPYHDHASNESESQIVVYHSRGMEQLRYILSSIAHLDLGGRITKRQEHASKFGGSCDVYSAWSTKHKHKVAVKRFRTHLIDDPSFAKVA